MKKTRILAFTFLVFISGCSSDQNNYNPEKWSEDRLSEWFTKMDWKSKINLQPHPSIDKREFAVRYHQNPERWERAFTFIKDIDLSEFNAGTYEIDDRDVFVIVFEYDSKNPEDVLHESHKIYSDIHYVVSGAEYIRLTDPSEATTYIPYDEDSDIKFHNVGQGQNLLAEPGIFFVFQPGIVHGPGMRVEDNIPVKKVVIKVRD